MHGSFFVSKRVLPDHFKRKRLKNICRSDRLPLGWYSKRNYTKRTKPSAEEKSITAKAAYMQGMTEAKAGDVDEDRICRSRQGGLFVRKVSCGTQRVRIRFL